MFDFTQTGIYQETEYVSQYLANKETYMFKHQTCLYMMAPSGSIKTPYCRIIIVISLWLLNGPSSFGGQAVFPVKTVTLPETNIAPETLGLEDEFPVEKASWRVLC